MRLRRAVAVVATASMLFGACRGDNPKLAKPKTTPTSTASLTNPSQPDENTETTEFQPVDPDAYTDSGDYDNGRHAGLLKSFANTRIGIDVVQFLTGDEAKEAYAADTGNTGGPDNDYYIRNQSKTIRNLPVDRDVVIRVNNTGGYPPSDPDKGHEVSVETFKGYYDNGTSVDALFWITIKRGLIVSIEEQYLP